MICPLCKREYSSPPALSRTDNKTSICPRCGTRQALETLFSDSEKINGILTTIYGDGVDNLSDMPDKKCYTARNIIPQVS